MARSVVSRLFTSFCKTSHLSRNISMTTCRFDDSAEQDAAENKFLLVEKNEEFKIMSIGINRPSKRNCVNKNLADKLFQTFYDFEQDDDMHCAVLHGIGGNFCAGYDLSELAEIEKDNIANEIVRTLALSSS